MIGYYHSNDNEQGQNDEHQKWRTFNQLKKKRIPFHKNLNYLTEQPDYKIIKQQLTKQIFIRYLLQTVLINKFLYLEKIFSNLLEY